MNPVRTTAFSPDGTWIVSGDGKTVKVWHADTGKAHTARLPLDGGVFHGVAFSKHGKVLATGSDREVKIWDGRTFDKKAVFSVPGPWLAFTPDGKTLLAANHSLEPAGNHKVARLDLATAMLPTAQCICGMSPAARKIDCRATLTTSMAWRSA